MSVPNREGKTYRNKGNDAIVVVVKTTRVSAGTARHTVLVLDPGSSEKRKAGEQVEIDELPVQKWDKGWEEV
jgi:hypothetical protein